MPRAKKITGAPIQETSAEETQAEVINDTPAKAAYREFIERYKEQNPEKYETRKAEFERQLKGDIRMEVNNQSKRTTFIFSNTSEE